MATFRAEQFSVRVSDEGTVAFAGFRFPREVIAVAVRWYLRYGLSYRVCVPGISSTALTSRVARSVLRA